MEFFVESILEHRGDIQRKTSLEFLDEWLRYSDEHNSWNSYANTDKLHEYMTSNNLHQLIPKKFSKDINTTNMKKKIIYRNKNLVCTFS